MHTPTPATNPHNGQQPFDMVDLAFLVVTAVCPPVFVIALVQYFARRSSVVAGLLLDNVQLSDGVARALLPGAVALLPAPDSDTGTNTDTTSMLSTKAWIAALNESPHLLIYGPSKAGKSTLAQAYVATFGPCEYVVIDPMPNKPQERKWGGVDFITLDEEGDEYASIKHALTRIEDEDTARRRAMRTVTPTPLVVIIDESLLLVDALGVIENEVGKKEPRFSQFIRKMGASARHRGIKIVLLGQGKNLDDLGLKSGTARNNYALVRVARNAATNERSAFIVADGEQAIELRHVPQLATAATQKARLWLAHSDLVGQQQGDSYDLLSSLLGRTAGNLGAVGVTNIGNEVPDELPRVPAAEREVPDELPVPVTVQEAAKIAVLLQTMEPGKVAKSLDGYHPRNYAEYKAKVDQVVAMLGQD